MPDPRAYQVGEFTVLGGDRQVLRDGREIPLRPKAFDTLLCLLEAGGRLVTKEDLLKRVWPGTFVSDAVLTHCVSEVRQALERALEERDPMMVWVPHMPAFAPLRGTQRFERVLRAAHLS